MDAAPRSPQLACRRLAALLFYCLLSTVYCLLPASAQDLSSYQDRPVARVDISFGTGQENDGGEFRQLVEQTVRAGAPLSAEAVHRSIERLLSTGVASRVSVEVAFDGPDHAGVVVTYHIVRQARIAALRFEGVEAAAADELRARVPRLDVGQRVTRPAVDQAAEEIVRYFQERGYFDVRVKPDVQLDATGTRATIVFGVTPGEQARVATFNLVHDGDQVPGVEESVQLDPGDPFTRAALEADLIAIRDAYLRAGYLAPEVGQPEVVRNAGANTVAISVRVNPGPRVEVAVEGADFSQGTLRKILPIYTEGGLDEYQLSEGDRRVADELQRGGYFFARVTHRVEGGATPASKRVVYTVDRGRRYRVTDIEIEGTTAVTYADVALDLQSREAGFFLQRGITSRDLLQRDSDAIERRLRSIGYRKAQVTGRRLGVTPDSDSLVITFVVAEGPRTRVADVAVRGNQIFAAPELLPSPAVKPGEFYSDRNISTDANAILQKYADAGYVSAEVTTDLVNLDGETARLVFNVAEGRKAYVGDIQLAGNVRTRPDSVGVYYRFEPGDVLKVDDLRKAERDLYDTGAFSQVIIHSEPIGPTADGLGENRTVYVDVTETKPWVLVYGGGFNTDDGPRGIVEISDVNLFGRLNTGAIRLRGSRRDQLAQISYSNPVPMGWKLPALFSVQFQREIKDAFSVVRFTTLAQLQKKLNDRTGFFFRYNFQEVRPFDLQLSPDELERNDRNVRLGRLSATYYRDTRNNPFDPDQGSFATVDAWLVSRALGGNEQFLRLYGEYQQYEHVPKAPKLVYAGAVKLGVEEPYGQSTDIPISERFFSGGSRTLRGFGFEQAGPRDPVTNQPVGGNLLVVINNELRFPLFWRFGGAVFSDTGNVFARPGDFAFNRLTETLGIGLSFDTPVGPVRIDFGYLTNPPAGVKNTAFHLNFGQAF